jgi:uncharacterized protein YkwD
MTLQKLTTVAVGAACLIAMLFLSLSLAPAASAQKCRHAHSSPKRVSTKKAQRAVFCLLNNARQRHGLHKLDRNDELHRASKIHTGYMRRHGCFEHQCPGEASIDGRLHRVHYLKKGLRAWRYGENIGYGIRRWASPKAMVKAWMHSPPHRDNILNPDFRDLGIGIKWGTPGHDHARGGIYTTDFGLRRG